MNVISKLWTEDDVRDSEFSVDVNMVILGLIYTFFVM